MKHLQSNLITRVLQVTDDFLISRELVVVMVMPIMVRVALDSIDACHGRLVVVIGGSHGNRREER